MKKKMKALKLYLPAKENFDKLADALRQSRGEITFDSILTQNPEVQKAIEYAKILATLPNPTLIYGETGTGKELFAQAMRKKGFTEVEEFSPYEIDTFKIHGKDTIFLWQNIR